MFLSGVIVVMALAIPKTPLPIKHYSIRRMQITPTLEGGEDDLPPIGATSINCGTPWNLNRTATYYGRYEHEYRFTYGQGEVLYQSVYPNPKYSHYWFDDSPSDRPPGTVERAVLHGPKIYFTKCFKETTPYYTAVYWLFNLYDVKADSIHEIFPPNSIYKEESSYHFPPEPEEEVPATYDKYCLVLNTWENGVIISSEIIPGSCWYTPQWTY